MQVTMADGSRKALMEVQLGDEVKSWNFETDSPTASRVVDILTFHRDSLMELRLETGDIIYSTDDHPYWSHNKKCMVSRDPSSTLSLYEIHASQLDDEEVFINEDGKPVAGSVSNSRRTASAIIDGVAIPDAIEVMTLRLDPSHWFYVQGVLVHNKGDDDKKEMKKVGWQPGGRGGGVVLGGVPGYRRRRGDINLDECYVIDKSHSKCQDDDEWHIDECKQASEKEYNANQACYDCQDDECIKSLCEEKTEDCFSGSETCSCGGYERQSFDEQIKDECKAVDGECLNETAYRSCCVCFQKMQTNVKCDEEEYVPSLLPIVVAIIGAAVFVLGFGYVAVKKLQARFCGNKAEEKQELYLAERKKEGAACGSSSNPKAAAPSSGKWFSSYLENGTYLQSTYDLEFQPSGYVKGTGTDSSGPFSIKHGVYNVNTGKVMWLEAGQGWQCEVSLEYADDPKILRGTYIANNGVEDEVKIFFEADAPPTVPTVKKGQVLPVTDTLN